MRKFTLPLSVIFLFMTSALFGQDPTLSSEALFPPNPELGKCYQRCVIPGKIETKIDSIVADVQVDITVTDPRPSTVTQTYESDGQIGYEVTPTTWTDEVTKVVVNEPSSRFIPKDGRLTTKTITEVIEPEKVVYDCTDPIYRDVVKRIKVKDEIIRYIPIPATYKTITEEVMVQEEHEEIEVVPGEFDFRTVDYVSSEPYFRYEVVPAESKKVVVEKFLKIPATKKWVQKRDEGICDSPNPDDCLTWCYVEEPPVYDVITKKEYFKDGSSDSFLEGNKEIKKVPVPAERGSYRLRYVKTPSKTNTRKVNAKFKTITKRVVDQPASIREEVIPAVFEEITVQELVKEGECSPRTIPAVTRDIEIQVVAEPASYEEEPIPAGEEEINIRKVNTKASVTEITIPGEKGSYTVTKWTEPQYTTTKKEVKYTYEKILTQEVSELTEWREVVCKPTDPSATLETIGQGGYPRDLMIAVQNALMARGFDLPQFGADGNFGGETREALNEFQRGAGLGVGPLTIESLKSLNIPKSLWDF